LSESNIEKMMAQQIEATTKLTAAVEHLARVLGAYGAYIEGRDKKQEKGDGAAESPAGRHGL
jgi:hypothetical protein